MKKKIKIGLLVTLAVSVVICLSVTGIKKAGIK